MICSFALQKWKAKVAVYDGDMIVMSLFNYSDLVFVPTKQFLFFYFNDKSSRLTRVKLSQLHLLSKDPTRIYNKEVVYTGAEKSCLNQEGIQISESQRSVWFKGLSSLLILKVGISVNWSKGRDCDQMLNILSPSVFPHRFHSLYLNTKSKFQCVFCTSWFGIWNLSTVFWKLQQHVQWGDAAVGLIRSV